MSSAKPSQDPPDLASEALVVSAPQQTTSSIAPPSAFVPRTVKKRPHKSTTLARTVRTTPSSEGTIQASSSSSRPSIAPLGPTPLSSGAAHAPSHQAVLAPQEVQRLEQILTVIESSFSTHGLTCYRTSSGLLDKLEGSEWIHLSQVLGIAPVRALTSTLVDLRNAVKLRNSAIIKVDEAGYSISRRDTSLSIDELKHFDLSIWNDLTVHLENIPFNTSLNSISPLEPTTFSLTHFLSSSLETSIQKIVIPALYDPKNPTLNLDEQDEEDASLGDGVGSGGTGEETSQAQAFKASIALAALQAKQLEEEKGGGSLPGPGVGGSNPGSSRNRMKPLPRGGGPFKGFAFVVLKDRAEVERVLREWDGHERSDVIEEEADSRQDEGEDVKMENGERTVEKVSSKTKGKDKIELTCREKAQRGGLKAMPLSRWLELKREYLAYRRTVEKLVQAHSTGELDQLRNPPDVRDRPPHLQPQPPQQQREQGNESVSVQGSKPTTRVKRASSPVQTADLDLPSSKRSKRAPSPQSASSLLVPTTTTRHTRKLRTPSPLPPDQGGQSGTLDLTSDVALAIQGAYPLGCVLWVRNVHEKSSKTSLKQLFGKLLDTLQEGSGKGVEFVDYEKGLETCYIRFSSAPLATLAESHFLSTITYHLSPPTLSPVDSLTQKELEDAQQNLRRPLSVELLRAEQERLYWASLPESTRKAARLGAGGKVGLIKEPRGYNHRGDAAYERGEERGGGSDGKRREVGPSGNGAGNDGGPNKKRKKPSRM